MAKSKSTVLRLLVLTMAAVPGAVVADIFSALSGHTTTIASGVMHIVGGNTPTSGASTANSPTNNHYTLDLTQPFNTTSPPVTPIPAPVASSPSAPPPLSHHTSALRGDNQSFVVWGGGTSSNFTGLLSPETIYIFWTKNISWTTGTIPVGPKQRRYHTAVINSTDNTWFDVYGGVQDSATGASAATPVVQNSVWGCDTSAFTWSNLTASTVQRYQHSSVILANGHTIVLGGLQQYVDDSAPTVAQAFASLDQIQLYDSVAASWSTQASTGATPPSRAGHSAVLTSENQILIYGGYGVDGNPLNDVHILDPSTLTWYQPNVTGTAPDPRYFHTANYVNDQMIVVGGSGASNAVYGDVQVLAKALATVGSTVPSFAWVNSYSPSGPNLGISSNPNTTTSTPAHNAAAEKTSGIASVLVAVVIGLVVVAL